MPVSHPPHPFHLTGDDWTVTYGFQEPVLRRTCRDRFWKEVSLHRSNVAPLTEGIHDNVFKCSCTKLFLLSTHNPTLASRELIELIGCHTRSTSALTRGQKGKRGEISLDTVRTRDSTIKMMRFLHHNICLIPVTVTEAIWVQKPRTAAGAGRPFRKNQMVSPGFADHTNPVTTRCRGDSTQGAMEAPTEGAWPRRMGCQLRPSKCLPNLFRLYNPFFVTLQASSQSLLIEAHTLFILATVAARKAICLKTKMISPTETTGNEEDGSRAVLLWRKNTFALKHCPQASLFPTAARAAPKAKPRESRLRSVRAVQEAMLSTMVSPGRAGLCEASSCESRGEQVTRHR
ncbi:hypothetical protein QTO34_012399, partial [Cnephaeus nilssonii]